MLAFIKEFYSCRALYIVLKGAGQIFLIIFVPLITAAAISAPVFFWHPGFGIFVFLVLTIIGLIKSAYAADKAWPNGL